MQNVPKIVRERLKVAPPAVNHPDADMLTAFSERSLPEFERALVLEHLALCGDCREIVALALPVEQEFQTVTRPVPSGWLTWPVLRWGFVAAGVVVIASLGVRQFERHSNLAMRTYDSRLETAAPEAKSESLPVAPPLPATTESVKVQPTLATRKAAAADLTAKLATPSLPTNGLMPKIHVPQRGTGSGAGMGVNHGPLVANQVNQFQYNSNSAQQQAAAPAPVPFQSRGYAIANAPAASQTVTVEAQSAPLSTSKSLQPLVNQRLDQQPSEGGSAETVVGQAKPADTLVIKSRPKYLVPYAPSQFNTVGAFVGTNPQWTVNSAGGLQRSFDHGNTWQDVNVNGLPGAAELAANFDMPMTSRAKAMDDNKDNKLEDKKRDEAAKQKAPVVVFRAVTASGPDVWAGGSSGFLYHSTDSGAHWIRVIPSSAAGVLTGDIISVNFADALNGKVTTSTSEIWLTADGGQTWQKQ